MSGSNGEATLPRGPATRSTVKTRKKGKYALSILKRLTGHRFAFWATKAIRFYGLKAAQFEFETSTGFYKLNEGGRAHAFSNPKRVWTLFNGQRSRGISLGQQYLLDQIEFAAGDRIIDVGANSGDLSLLFDAIDVSVEYFAFEPSPPDFAVLEHNLGHSKTLSQFKAYN
ncbi:MAG: hypothetical protein AAF826_06650, partial [Pseudomonadota bacterium]